MRYLKRTHATLIRTLSIIWCEVGLSFADIDGLLPVLNHLCEFIPKQCCLLDDFHPDCLPPTLSTYPSISCVCVKLQMDSKIERHVKEEFENRTPCHVCSTHGENILTSSGWRLYYLQNDCITLGTIKLGSSNMRVICHQKVRPDLHTKM